MARLNDTVVHGLIDVFDGYYITEKKHKLAVIQDNTLLLADIGLNTTLRGINMLICLRTDFRIRLPSGHRRLHHSRRIRPVRRSFRNF